MKLWFAQRLMIELQNKNIAGYKHFTTITRAYCNYKDLLQLQGFPFNYPHVLEGVNYKFLWVDVGTNLSLSAAQMLAEVNPKMAIYDGSIGIQEDEILPEDDRNMSRFLIGDDTIALRTWLMKFFKSQGLPNDQKNFNYKLSCAR